MLPIKKGFEPRKSLNIRLRTPDHATNTWCHSKYKKLCFGCEPLEFLIGRRANYSPVGKKFLLGGFLNAGPYVSLTRSSLNEDPVSVHTIHKAV